MNLFRPIDRSCEKSVSWRKDLNGRPRRSHSSPARIFSLQVVAPRNQQHQLSLDPIREHASELESSIPGVS